MLYWMNAPQIAFLHVGSDTVCPTVLVRSLRASNPNARIIQCSDRASPAVAGVDEVARFDSDPSRLMTFRLEAFAGLAIRQPTFFLDTDMICLQPLDPAAALQGQDVAVCRREYQRDMMLDPSAMNMDLREYRGRTIGEVYPYLACAVATAGPAFWASCRDDLARLPEKFRVWFGDQEAIRNVVDSGRYSVGWLHESTYACLIDIETDPAASPKICHFKGPGRKQLMLDCARQAGLLDPAGASAAEQPASWRVDPVTVEGVRFDLSGEDLADLALQRSGPLIALGGGDALGRWFARGDKASIAAFLREPDASREFLRAVVNDIAAEVDILLKQVDLSGVARMASIGPGHAIFELMLYRRHQCRQYLIDIERSGLHRHGFNAQGAGYSNNAAARNFLLMNGVPSDAVVFCNPRKQPLDPTPVDLVLSTISMGFHYPLDEYVGYIDAVLRPGAMLIFDKRKDVEDRGWAALAPKFERLAGLDHGKSLRLVCRRRA